MLGYVRCATGDLLVKHHHLYQAMYCGLCHSIGKNATKALLPFLSYDFVFLALLRMAVIGEQVQVEKQFCPLHPLKSRKKRVADNASLRYASQTALFLTYEKMRDDLSDRDCSFARRILFLLWTPLLKGACGRVVKQDPELAPLLAKIESAMEQGRSLERGGASLDEMCASFSSCLSVIFSYGTKGDGNRILSSVGDLLGRFLYTVDALDDLERDEKKGSFNPILQQYGTVEKAKGSFAQLDLVLSYYISQMKLALDLLDGDRELLAICENIICLGLTRTVGNIMKSKLENTK